MGKGERALSSQILISCEWLAAAAKKRRNNTREESEQERGPKKPFKVHVDINMLARTMHINFSISVHYNNVTFIGLAACPVLFRKGRGRGLATCTARIRFDPVICNEVEVNEREEQTRDLST